jgi:hypothetical protein
MIRSIKRRPTFDLAMIALLFLMVWGCKKEKTTWDADFTVPIAQTTLSINQLIADSLLTTDANNHLNIVYQSRLLNYDIDSVVNLPDTVTSYALTASGSGTLNPGQVVAMNNDVKSFAFEPARITQVDIEKGLLVFTCINPLNTPLKVTYSIPAAKRFGVSFALSETIPAASGNTPYVYTNKIDLSSYSIDMRGPDLDNANRFQTSLYIVTDPNGGNATVSAGQQFVFYTNFEGLKLKYIKGYLGNDIQTSGPDTSYIDFFKKISAGTLSLNSIDVSLKISNGIGADISMTPQLLTGNNSRTNHSVAISGDIIGKTYNFTRSTETHQSLNPVIPTTSTINFSGTNILSVIENLPDQFIFKSTLRINPMGNISCGNDFIYAGNGLTADLSLRIPLTFKANTLTLADTLNYTMSQDSSQINSGSISLLISNSFPVSAKIKLYILNSNRQITDELTLNNQQITSGYNDASNTPIPVNSVVKMDLPSATLKRFLHSKQLLLVAELNTSGSNFVSINANSKIQVKMVGNFNTNIEF